MMETLADWREHPVLITGASAGIGLACAETLVDAGARQLLLTARHPQRLQDVRQQLEQRGKVQVDIQVCDHRERDDLERLIAHLASMAPLGAFIANLGINPVHESGPKKIHGLSYALCQSIITTNILHTTYLLSAVLKGMRQNRSGRILLMGSQAYRHGIPGQALYNLSKSSLVGLKNSVVAEYGAQSIFCHLLNPGIVLNERTRRLRQKHAHLADQQTVSEQDVAREALRLLSIDEPARNGLEVDI